MADFPPTAPPTIVVPAPTVAPTTRVTAEDILGGVRVEARSGYGGYGAPSVAHAAAVPTPSPAAAPYAAAGQGYGSHTGGYGYAATAPYGGGGYGAAPSPGGYGGGGGYGGSAPGGYGGGYGGGGGSYGNQGGLGSNLQAVDYTKVDMVTSQWQYYQQANHSTSAEVDAWRRQHQISIMGDAAPEPMTEFMDLVAPEAIHRAFKDQGFERPTPIQSQSWPILLQSRDMIGIAKTGSGKTLAFIVPALLHINAQPPLRLGDGPIVLVMAPTRELACQIEEEARKVAGRCNLQVVCVYGGAPKPPQMRALRAGTHVCVATPGRLIDMLEGRATNLYRITYLVLDEADRMLDMGFEPQVRKICSQIRPDRQTLMFSATWPEDVRRLAESFMRAPIRIHVGSTELMANADVRQHIIVLQSEHDKNARLFEIMRQIGRQRCLVFTKTKKVADDIYHDLRRAGYNALVIHGDKEQSHRDRTLARLKHETDAVLVATDVAARGLDVKNLDCVINFDFPGNIEDYVHRIGRTGRAGQTGDAYSFVVSEAPKLIRDLRMILIKAKQPVPPELDRVPGSTGGGRFGGPRRGGFGGGGGGYGGGSYAGGREYVPRPTYGERDAFPARTVGYVSNPVDTRRDRSRSPDDRDARRGPRPER